MQTILGAGGAIGKLLASELPHYTSKIRLVSRNPEKVNENDEIISADLLNPASTSSAVEGSDVVYLTAGLPYNARTWKAQWPVIMQNTINACREHNSKLVFFDNVYMYHPEAMGNMTENARIQPVSKKGEVRKEIAEMLLNASASGKIQGLVARSADFYGPDIGHTSVLNETVIKPLVKGNTANWLGNKKYKHSLTYTVDAAKSTALLGNSPKAYGQVWHLPTSKNPPTGEEYVTQIAHLLGIPPKVRNTPRVLLTIMGLFSPVMKELAEMCYQYERDYIFNSQKFEKEFDFKPTPYKEGLKQTLENDYPDRMKH